MPARLSGMLSGHTRAVNRQLDRLDQHVHAATLNVLSRGRVQIGRVERVLPWFHAGAAGFFVTVVGMALIALGIAASFWRGP
jgi:hypothetical protein